MPRTIKHQLVIHLDYAPSPDALEIRYNYPFTDEHHLREQVIRIPRTEIDRALKRDLDSLVEGLKTRVPTPTPVRLPHADVTPRIRPAITTLMVQDQTRADQLPIARMYYHEEIPELGSNVEKQVRLERPDFTSDELATCQRIQAAVRAIAWKSYSALVAPYLRSK